MRFINTFIYLLEILIYNLNIWSIGGKMKMAIYKNEKRVIESTYPHGKKTQINVDGKLTWVHDDEIEIVTPQVGDHISVVLSSRDKPRTQSGMVGRIDGQPVRYLNVKIFYDSDTNLWMTNAEVEVISNDEVKDAEEQMKKEKELERLGKRAEVLTLPPDDDRDREEWEKERRTVNEKIKHLSSAVY